MQIYVSYLTFPYLRFLWEYSSRAALKSSRLKSGHKVSTKEIPNMPPAKAGNCLSSPLRKCV